MSLIDRVKGILLQPRQEWAVIDSESATVGSIYTGYVLPLAAIPAVSAFIGMSVVGWSFLGTAIKIPMSLALQAAAVHYVGALAGVYVLALIIDALAPSFGGTKSPIQALKLSAYSNTAAWIAGIFMLIPGLRMLTIAGLYSLVLLFLGLPVLMKAPEDKAFGYVAVVGIAAVVLYLIVGQIAGRIIGPGSLVF